VIAYAKALLFDNDGVLVDSHAAAIEAWAKWSEEFAPHFDWNQPENAGRRAEDKVREQVHAHRFEEANNRINALEQETAHHTKPLPGAVELLASLEPGTWTVCTSANPDLGKARLKAAGLPIPKELVTAADVERGKPHPDAYLLGAERLGFDAVDCVVFEDAEAGVIAAAEAGVGLIVGIGEAALSSQADIVVRNLEGIRFANNELFIPDNIRLR
jgi:sugar-phosphatase